MRRSLAVRACTLCCFCFIFLLKEKYSRHQRFNTRIIWLYLGQLELVHCLFFLLYIFLTLATSWDRAIIRLLVFPFPVKVARLWGIQSLKQSRFSQDSIGLSLQLWSWRRGKVQLLKKLHRKALAIKVLVHFLQLEAKNNTPRTSFSLCKSPLSIRLLLFSSSCDPFCALLWILLFLLLSWTAEHDPALK